MSASGQVEDAVSTLRGPADGDGEVFTFARPERKMVAVKANCERLLERLGPVTVAVLIGQRQGRWWRELNGSCKASKAALKLVSAAASQSGAVAAAQAEASDIVVGVAAIRGWRCVHDAASDDRTYALMKASADFHRQRSGQRCLEHMVVAAAVLQRHDDRFMVAPVSCDTLPADVAGPKLMQHLTSTSQVMVLSTGRDRGQSKSIGQLMSEWGAAFGADWNVSVAWPVTSLLAVALASGQWPGDVSVRFRRGQPSDSTMAPVLPSAKALRHFMAAEVGDVKPPQSAPASGSKVWDTRRGAVRRYNPKHIVDSLRAGADLRSQAKLKRTLLASFRWFYPKTWKAKLASAEVQLKDAPHAATLRRSIVRLDWAAMLARRQWYKKNGPTFRYIAYDASPQRQHEFFVTVERVVRKSSLEQAVGVGQRPAVEARILPLCVLGFGRMGLAEKLQTHVHQVWLEYGPAVDDVRSANLDVRQCLSDMGTEFAIADANDVVAECLGQQSEDLGDAGRLYPLALTVPGPQHIIDVSLQRGLQALQWWPAWQRSAKVVCQWMRPANHRLALEDRIQQLGGDPDVVAARKRALGSGCNAFAAWRWKTLVLVTKDLQRMKDAVCAAISTVRSAKDLSSRDGGQAAFLLESVRDPAFLGTRCNAWQVGGSPGQLLRVGPRLRLP